MTGISCSAEIYQVPSVTVVSHSACTLSQSAAQSITERLLGALVILKQYAYNRASKGLALPSASHARRGSRDRPVGRVREADLCLCLHTHAATSDHYLHANVSRKHSKVTYFLFL